VHHHAGLVEAHFHATYFKYRALGPRYQVPVEYVSLLASVKYAASRSNAATPGASGGCLFNVMCGSRKPSRKISSPGRASRERAEILFRRRAHGLEPGVSARSA